MLPTIFWADMEVGELVADGRVDTGLKEEVQRVEVYINYHCCVFDNFAYCNLSLVILISAPTNNFPRLLIYLFGCILI